MDKTQTTVEPLISAAQLLVSTVSSYTDGPDDLNDVDSDETHKFSRSLLTFAAVMTIIIMIVGIFGNILTTVALLKCPKVRNVAAAFIISLCIADCIFCAVVLPFNAFRFIQGAWTHGDILCKLIPFIQYGNIGVSLLCIAMITINRYIMIAHHTAYAKIYKRFWIGAMIVFCWAFSYGMQLPTLFSVWGQFAYDKNLGTCSITKDRYGRSSKTSLFVIAFIVPCIIIIACYARIFWVVHESEVRMRKHAHKQNSIPNNMRKMPSGTDPNRSSAGVSSSSFDTSGVDTKTTGASQKAMRIKDQRDAKAKRNEWRITKMVLAIFLSFIACYLPITIVKVLDPDVDSPGFHIIGYLMLYLSACINPIIYVIMNKQYRQAYKTVLMCKPSNLLRFGNIGSNIGEKWKDIGFNYNHSRTMVSQVSMADGNSNNSTSQPALVELTNTTAKYHAPNKNIINNNNQTGIMNNNANVRKSWLMNSTNGVVTNNIFPTSTMTILNTNSSQPISGEVSVDRIQSTPNNIQKQMMNNATVVPVYNPITRSPVIDHQHMNNNTIQIQPNQSPTMPYHEMSAQIEIPPSTIQDQPLVVQQQRSMQHPGFQRPGIRITLDEDVIVEEEEEDQQIHSTRDSKTLEDSMPSIESKSMTTINLKDTPDNNNTKIINSNNNSNILNDKNNAKLNNNNNNSIKF